MSKKPLTELRDADIRRVDAVKGAANGTRFLIAKASAGEAGIVSPEEVRGLIAEPAPTVGEDTYLGAAGEILKAEMSGADQNDLPDSDFAYIEPGGKVEGGKTTPRSLRHFLINDEAHVRNALARLPQSPFESKARPKVEAAARRMGIGEPAEVTKHKESPMTAPADQVPAASGTNELKAARAVLKQAKLAKKAGRLQKQALMARARQLVAKGTLHNLADAHEAVLEALKGQEDPEDAKKFQSLADDIAGMMSDHAMGESDAAAVPDDGEDGETAPVEKAKPVTLRKAKAAAKAARLEKRAARDRIAVAKAQATLAKIGRRNSTSDQAHVDAIDNHAAALGATAHLTTSTGTPLTPAAVQKAGDEQVAGAIDLIQKAIGPLFGEKLEAIRGDLTEVSQQVAKIAKTPLSGGPRVVLERDGSVVGAPDGQPGLTYEQAVLAKVAASYPVGSVQREALEKAAATSAIKDLMEARDRR